MSSGTIETPTDQPSGETPEYGIPFPMPNSYVRRQQLEDLATKVEEALIAQRAQGVTPEQKAVIDQLKAPGPSDLFWTYGDGTASVFTFTHNLNSRRFVADTWLHSGTYEAHMPDIRKPDPNTLVVDFGSYVPAAGEYDLCIVPLTVIHGPGEDNLTAEMVTNAINSALTAYNAQVTAQLAQAQATLDLTKQVAFSTAQRDALTVDQKWQGRVILNTTKKQYEGWTGTRWHIIGVDHNQRYAYFTTQF